MILALLSGLLLAFSFPTVIGKFSSSLWPLAWLGLTPVYWAVQGASFKKAFGCGVATGFLLYGISLYWIFIAMHFYGEVSVGATLTALFLLVFILSLFIGGAFLLAVFLRSRGVPMALAFSLSWLLQDWVRNFFPCGGFSWSSLCYSQGVSPFLQIVDLTGPYGITFLILVHNALWGEIVLFLKKRRTVPTRLAFCLVVLLGVSLLYGFFRRLEVKNLFQNLPEKKLVLVQGNIPQELKWVSENMEEILGEHLELSQQAGEFLPDLLIWSEASYPAVIPPDLLRVGTIDILSTPLLMGAMAYTGTFPEEWPPAADADFRLYNSAFLVEPGGFVVGQYNKNHLVPMGEYVPLRKLFFFIDKIVPGFTDFSPGKSFHLLETSGMKMGVTICYEDLFPEISRNFVNAGADFLVNLTNDAWYEHSSAVFQHVEFSRFRAIENRRFLARATNTGVTAVFDPTGQEVARAPLFQAVTLPATIRLGGPVTFYTQFGDVFLLTLGVASGLFLKFRKKN